ISATIPSTCLLCSGVRFAILVNSSRFFARRAASVVGEAFVTTYFWCANTYPIIPPSAAPSRNTTPTHNAAFRVVEFPVIVASRPRPPVHHPHSQFPLRCRTNTAAQLPSRSVPPLHFLAHHQTAAR